MQGRYIAYVLLITFAWLTLAPAPSVPATGRAKAIHTVGSAARVRFVVTSTNNLYTGMFKGSESSILRCSTAKIHSAKSVVPGVSWKAFRAGACAEQSRGRRGAAWREQAADALLRTLRRSHTTA